MKKLLKYDLGCGQRKQEGHTGVDIVKCKGVDVVWDLKKFPYKFAKSETADEIYCSHFFEHMTGEERMKFMDECYRILIKGGKMTIICPYYTSLRASQDPTHMWPPVSEASFLYFNKGWREANKLDHYPISCDFDYSFGYNIQGEWMARNDETKMFAVAHYCNAVADIYLTLTKK